MGELHIYETGNHLVCNADILLSCGLDKGVSVAGFVLVEDGSGQEARHMSQC